MDIPAVCIDVQSKPDYKRIEPESDTLQPGAQIGPCLLKKQYAFGYARVFDSDKKFARGKLGQGVLASVFTDVKSNGADFASFYGCKQHTDQSLKNI